ncbi:HlyD family secretion protein [Pseudooceanicola sp. LIPI14-2-Ac024]|uniref:HlyD family secretion protein n=1 Tax=Pseudooceanicola sp. LIPI14-2-Ac024 TaxID=3344875 RepID=UPI0035CFC007
MNARADDMEQAAPVATAATPPAEKPKGKGRRRMLMISVPLALAVVGGGYWLLGGRYISTDNAYVHQPMISVSPDVAGRVTEVLVHENQVIAAGTPLFRIDPTDYRIALDNAEAQLAAARLAVEQQRAAYATANAQLEAARGIEDVKKRELARQEELTSRGIGSQAALDEATVAARSATNSVAVAQSQLAAAAAALGGDPEAETDTLPAVRAALSAREAAERNLAHTEVKSATGGTVSQIESLNVGQFISTGSSIAKLVDSSDTWIEANFKETQLGKLVPGQRVTIEVDAYPDLELSGEVESFGSATGSQFSLIPAQNATGNWVKVVQRVPVRIKLDEAPELALRDGMSVSVSVDTGHSRLDDL